MVDFQGRTVNLPEGNVIYHLVNVYITDGKITIFNGKIHYFYGHFQ